MTLAHFIEGISKFDDLSASQMIDYFGYYKIEIEKKDFFLPKDIENCFNVLNITSYSNIASYLSNKSKGKGKLFIKNKQGYVIERKTFEQITKSLGVQKAPAPSDNLFPIEILKTTRGYIEHMASQAALCYDYGLYDACLVMVRKLIETLIIELFEFEKISDKIKDKDGHFFYLSDLITKFQSEDTWNLSRNTTQSLPIIKKYGDLSAHNRRFSAKKPDLEKLKPDLRIVLEELIHLIDYANRK